MLTKKDKNYLKQLLENEKMYYTDDLESNLKVSEYNNESYIQDNIQNSKLKIKHIESLILKLSK